MQTIESLRTIEVISSSPPITPSADGCSLFALLAKARSGERSAREDLLQQYRPLVLHVVSRVRGRYVQIGRDPEIGIGLLALNSAIDGYQPERGTFVAFATLIIKRRLIDFDRSQKKTIEWTFSDFESTDDEGTRFSRTLSRQAMEQQRGKEDSDDRREEIHLYAQRLQEFGIQFQDLESESPKRDATRRRMMTCILELVRNHSLRDHLLRTKELPLKELLKIIPMTRKTLERNRRYIIAMALVFLGGFEFLRNYLTPYIEQPLASFLASALPVLQI